jgi:hypothetical protein
VPHWLSQHITAFVVENMKERLGSHFMPHHTQLLTLLSFLESKTLHNGKDGNVIAQVRMRGRDDALYLRVLWVTCNLQLKGARFVLLVAL